MARHQDTPAFEHHEDEDLHMDDGEGGIEGKTVYPLPNQK
jgi:hypothetical protein